MFSQECIEQVKTKGNLQHIFCSMTPKKISLTHYVIKSGIFIQISFSGPCETEECMYIFFCLHKLEIRNCSCAL